MNSSSIPEPGHNICLATDSYKQSHYKMYPPGTEVVGSYLEARKGCEFKDTVFFGLQYLLNRYFSGQVVNRDKIEQADHFCQKHFGQDLFNRSGWEYILEKHGGCLPVEIHAVPEGTPIPESNVLLTIHNTDQNVPWLTNHLETLLVQLWYPCTIATISRELKKVLKRALEKSGSVEGLPFMLHNFGYRGSTSVESAAIADAAHLVNFMGTDTIAGIELLQKYYLAEMPAFSVPAAEHSTITSWGGPENELEAFRHIMDQYPKGLLSVVSDSYDVVNACENYWGKMEFPHKNQKIVVRPDSGDPMLMVPRCLDALASNRGYSINIKGYKILPDNLKMIQGDGITRTSLPSLVDEIMKCGWSLDNIVFGSGGGLVQQCDRDTQRFAMKCSWIQRNGKVSPVFKNPASDPSKSSKAGKLKLYEKGGNYRTQSTNHDYHWRPVLVPFFRNGQVLVNERIDEIRERAEV